MNVYVIHQISNLKYEIIFLIINYFDLNIKIFINVLNFFIMLIYEEKVYTINFIARL